MIGCFASRFRYLVMAKHRRFSVMSSTPMLSFFPLSDPDASIFCFSIRNEGAFGTDFGGGGGTIIPLLRYSCNRKACRDVMFSWVRVTQYSEKICYLTHLVWSVCL